MCGTRSGVKLVQESPSRARAGRLRADLIRVHSTGRYVMSQTLRHTMHTYDAATLQKQTNGLREGLSRRIEELLLPLIRGARRICLIDPPGHPNVGDSMILLGELDFLARYFPSAKLSFFDVDSYSPDAD